MWKSNSVSSTAVCGALETVGASLARIEAILERAEIADARAEARDILASILDVPRFWPAANTGERLNSGLAEEARNAAQRRARGAPLAYAVGRSTFRHLTLQVDERVLIPRPETEMLVEQILRMSSPGGIAVDIGTGSGAIALALASEGRFERVIATDISLGALAVAKGNAVRLGGQLRHPVEFRHGSIACPLAGVKARVVVSNPPYIAYEELGELERGVRNWEPSVALVCADRGLSVSRAIVTDSAPVLEAGGLLAMEVDCRRAADVAEFVASNGNYVDVTVGLDLTGRERFVFARRAQENG